MPMVKKSPSSPAAEPPSYEAALSELEQLVASMEGGQMPLDQLLDAYRRGAGLLAFCRTRLEAVEQQVQVLEAGQLQPWGEPR
jgi:exodeoxyribonuclease VII small subunit